MNDLAATEPTEPPRDLPAAALDDAFEAVVASPNTAGKRWVYRQYDHEVGVRTACRPGDDAAVIAVREAGVGLAISAGAAPLWTAAAPREGAKAVALENAANLASMGAAPLAAVDCLNGGNPEKPAVYGGFAAIVDGLADMCRALSVPVVGGNVSLYNDSESGPIPPTPTLMMVGTRSDYTPPTSALEGDGDLYLLGPASGRLGGSEYLGRLGGADRFPDLPTDPAAAVEAIVAAANSPATSAVHDVSHGGLAVTLAEMVHDGVGATVSIDPPATPAEALFSETPGRAVVETADAEALRNAVAGRLPVTRLGTTAAAGELSVAVDDRRLEYTAATIGDLRDTIPAGME